LKPEDGVDGMTILSNDEIKTVRRLIAQHRKFERLWRVLRWFILMSAFLCLAICAFGFYRMYEFGKITAAAHIVADPSPENIGRVLDARVILLRREFRNYSSTIVNGSIGGLLLATALFGWNGLARHAVLKAKLLEMALEKEQRSDIATELIKAVDA
jgi:hypothetical protein